MANVSLGGESPLTRFLWCLVILAVGGCTFTAGRNFARPAAGTLTLESITQSEVRARYGTPQNTGIEQVNGVNVSTDEFTYASNEEGVIGGVNPVRALKCYFVDGTLVGYSFVSSYPNDHTNFDSTKVDMIKENASTAKDVVALLGPPSGEYAPPMVAPPVERALVYRYSQVQISIAPFTDPTVHSATKELIAGLDANDVVVDVKYSSSQN